MSKATAREAEWFAYFARKYVQRADARQKSMGLVYTEAETHDLAKEAARFEASERAELVAALREAWKESAIAWSVCGSIHREYAKGKDALFTTRQDDFTRHADSARAALAKAEERG